ncbi:hypothetical protein D046_0042B, partial [Vibrio parahaemolyticus V-223/04]
ATRYHQTSIYRRKHRCQDLNQTRHALTVPLERFVMCVLTAVTTTATR